MYVILLITIYSNQKLYSTFCIKICKTTVFKVSGPSPSFIMVPMQATEQKNVMFRRWIWENTCY